MSATDWPNVRCCMGEDAPHCLCPAMEAALRGWKRGDPMAAMTAEQRAACLDEIDRIEGYRRSDHEADTDADLAGTVLSAWTDYCRDKGLL